MKPRATNVARLMTKEVHICRPWDRLNLAAQIMWDRDCGSVPVLGENGDVLGLVTDRDICMAAYTQNRTLSDIAVGEVMSQRVHSCAPTDGLEVAERLMQKHQVRRLPVLDADGLLVGILSLSDLARAGGKSTKNGTVGLSADAIEATLAAVCRPHRPGGSARADAEMLSGELSQ